MLPTKGYFQDIECPYFDNSCGRPYCHFRHRKKTQEIPENSSSKPVIKEPEVPTYKPTPKSELANIKSHIPISYVPDLAFRSDRTTRPIPKFNKPTYKPTPLSILSSVNKTKPVATEQVQEIEEIKDEISMLEYNPTISLQDDINFENLTNEFDLIDDIICEPEAVESKEKTCSDESKKQKPAKEHKKTESSRSSSSSNNKSSHKSKHSSSSSKSDTKDKHHDDDKHKTSKSRERDRHKSKHRSRDKEKDKDKKKTSSSSSKTSSSRSKTKEKDKEKEKKSKEETKTSNGDTDEVLEAEHLDFSDFEFADEEDDTLLECYKIFNEYKPPKPVKEEIKLLETPLLPEPVDDVASNKKRIAHSSSMSIENIPKVHYHKPKTLQTPAQVMANRLKIAKDTQGNNEQKNIINEIKQQCSVKRPASTELPKKFKVMKMQTKPKPVENTNLIDSILNGARTKPKKIAPVMNVNSIQRAKAKIEEMAKQKALQSLQQKTPAQNTKGTKRVAHVPDMSLSDIPDVLNADKSKLPVNVRTRFLTMIADECIKLYLIKEDAYTRALNEEFTCYEKCKVLATYKNSAMLAVSRLRKEFQDREKLGLGPILAGESSANDKSSAMKGKKFYERIKSYCLKEDELDVHGYPRESSIPGRAVIRNRKSKASSACLEENQRKCSRCSKIYLVDALGFVMYPEECVYHPLKKRTLRGEQAYLCCKSNDDMNGCATSNTHVSEMADEAELDGYQMTMDPERDDDPKSHAVYALDCEMCYTIKGLELTRVTIVDSECKTVYESLVKPLNPIIDYNTNFSGITKDQMDRTSTSILQVQANILHLCNSQTILIGHSLESDMKALKIMHGTIIDTSVLFPHKMGLPHKRALRVLASDYLKKIIQNNVNGHDSAEDAIACMDLVKWKLSEELKVRGIK